MKLLGNVVRGKIRKPLRVVLYGPEGVGKTTFGADAPDPVVMGAERGTEHLDVARLPAEELRGWKDVMQWLAVLAREPHDYKTLVVDTLDWLEAMLHGFVAREASKKTIEDWDYAKGYKICLPEWREFLHRLDVLRDHRGMHVVLLAHSKVSKFDDPAGESWDRYALKLHDAPKASAADLVKEWADVVLFANFDHRARKKNKWDRKGVGTARRLMWTERTAAFDAKNRCNLPTPMELSWGAFFSRAWGRPRVEGRELGEVLEQLRELAEHLPGDVREKTLAWCSGVDSEGSADRATIAKALNRVRCLVDDDAEPEHAQGVDGDGDRHARRPPSGADASEEAPAQGEVELPAAGLPKPVKRGGAA